MSDFGFDVRRTIYGGRPLALGYFDFDLSEVMYYLYLPVRMAGISDEIRLPPNLEGARTLIAASIAHVEIAREYRYVYITARKGWATPDNPLNRPGWHCDGFGTDDLNFIWWRGPGTRFAVQPFHNISTDHVTSMHQFEEQVRTDRIESFPERGLYCVDPTVVHATPLIGAPGCMRQFIKVSLSDERYNLENNSHNYLFDYNWALHPREMLRNNPAGAQADFIAKSPTEREGQ